FTRRRLDVGRRVLERSTAEVHVRRGRTEPEAAHLRSAVADRADQLRRRRPLPRPVLLDAQHRGRLEGQPLHDGNVPGPPCAEVRLQGARAGDEERARHALADGQTLTPYFTLA